MMFKVVTQRDVDLKGQLGFQYSTSPAEKCQEFVYITM